MSLKIKFKNLTEKLHDDMLICWETKILSHIAVLSWVADRADSGAEYLCVLISVILVFLYLSLSVGRSSNAVTGETEVKFGTARALGSALTLHHSQSRALTV